jgi:ABC-type dipeptide/oligopeptide/nickel transport system permease subunit
MSISFSVFGMLLIFGLGFVFPTINPYVVIKWIIIVAGVIFAYSFLVFLGRAFMGLKKGRKSAKK